MDLVRYLARIDIRRRWRSYAGIAFLLGLTAGPALFAIAGARRTASAYTRFLDAVEPPTLSISSFDSADPQKNAALVAALPNVVQSRTWVGLTIVVRDGARLLVGPEAIEAAGTFDGRHYDQDRFTATSGRVPDPTRVDEISVNEFAAELFDLRVGQHVELGTYSLEQQFADDFVTNTPRPALETQATIVGIGLYPEEVLQDDADRGARMMVTPAFTELAREHVTFGVQGLVLEHGDDDIATVKPRIEAALPDGTLEFLNTTDYTFRARQSIRPIAIAVGAFGVIVAAASLVLTAQAIARVTRAGREDGTILTALGARPDAVARATTVGPMLAVVGGTVLAVLVAFVLSPLMPFGAIRRVDPARGVDVDAAALGIGALVTIVLLCGFALLVALSSARTVRRGAAVRRPSRVARALGDAGISRPAEVGVRFAFESGGEARATPTRSVMFGGAIAVVALAAAFVFAASLDTLVTTPRLYGWNGDAAITAADGYGNIPLDGAREILDRDDNVDAWSGTTFGLATIDDLEVPVLGIAAGSEVLPPIVDGQPPRDETEALVGAETARALGKSVGDQVTIAGRSVRITGVATFPTIGKLHAAHTSLGVGALVAPELVSGYDLNLFGEQEDGLGPRAIFVRFREGVDTDVAIERLRTTTQSLASFAGLDVLPVQRPSEIVNSREIAGAPLVFAFLLVIGALVSLGLALAGSVRSHRRDLALLKTLGFTRRQLGVTVAAHATATTLVALLVGIPAGILIGRGLWELFADQLSVVNEPTVPFDGLLGLAVVTLVAANAAAAAPARAARRVRASILLRSE